MEGGRRGREEREGGWWGGRREGWMEGRKKAGGQHCTAL